MRDRKLFQSSLQNLEVLVRKAQQEAGYALLEQQQAGDSRALQELMRNTEQILSAVSLSGDRSLRKPKTRNATFMVPPRMPSFVGRQERIEEIHRHLQRSPDAAHSTYPRSVVLCGLGGMGKSQLAIQYAHLYKGSYHNCFWVTCVSEVKVAEDFLKIAGVLELGDHGFAQNLGNVKDWLCTTGAPHPRRLNGVEADKLRTIQMKAGCSFSTMPRPLAIWLTSGHDPAAMARFS